MKKTHFLTILLGATALAGCETFTMDSKTADIVLDDEPFIEAVYLSDADLDGPEVVDTPVAQAPLVARTFGPGISPKELAGAGETETLKPYQAIERANASAAIEPSPANYMNAIQIYPYTRGALYQVYTAPEQVTDIALQPGEELMSVSAGDTVRWVLGDTVSGAGDHAQVHILVKPIQAGLKTNLIITTSRRAYHLELHAFRETYMAAVSWRYSDQPLVRRSPVAKTSGEKSAAPLGLQLDRLRFRYEISGDKPHWRPSSVFDDGRKVYIQFPARLDQGEAPPLFVVGRDGKSQLVNYRMRDNYYVVDRLFAMAELRLGEKNQDVVRIERNDLQMASR